MTAQLFGYVPVYERLQNRRTVPDPSGNRVPVERRETVLAAARWFIWYSERWSDVHALVQRAPTRTADMVVTFVQMQDRLAAAADALAAAMQSHNIITVEQLSESLIRRMPADYDDEWIPAPIPLVRPEQFRQAAQALRACSQRVVSQYNLPTQYAQRIDYRPPLEQRMNGMAFLPAVLAAHPIACIVCGGIVALSGVIGVAYVLTMTVDQLLNFFDKDRESADAAIDVIRDTVQRQLRLCSTIDDNAQQQECIQRVQADAIESLATANKRINRGFDKYFSIVALAGVGVAGLYFITRKTPEQEPRNRRRRRYAA